MNRVAIIDYGLCNLDSVKRAVEEIGGRPYIVDDGRDLASPDHIVLPGVGSFAQAMANLRARSLDRAMEQEVLGTGIPLLGICLGMQLLATQGTEGGPNGGLGWVQGDVIRLESVEPGERVPHMGWNEVHPTDASALFDGIDSGTDFYFVHSYHFRAREPEAVIASTPYCGEFTSAVAHGLVFGVQFHPEKSQRSGFHVLQNFLEV